MNEDQRRIEPLTARKYSKPYHAGLMAGYGRFAEGVILGVLVPLAAKKELRHANYKQYCLQDVLDFTLGFKTGAADAAADDGWVTVKENNDEAQVKAKATA
jgi:hypothetical protein